MQERRDLLGYPPEYKRSSDKGIRNIEKKMMLCMCAGAQNTASRMCKPTECKFHEHEVVLGRVSAWQSIQPEARPASKRRPLDRNHNTAIDRRR
jgi:hypothetical protein